MICPEDVQRVAATVSAGTDLDPVGVREEEGVWVVEGWRGDRVQLRLHLGAEGELLAAWDAAGQIGVVLDGLGIWVC